MAEPTTIGASIAAIVLALGAVLAKWKPWASSVRAEVATNVAEASVVDTLRAEFTRLSTRVETMEREVLRLRRRTWQLEDELARHGMPVPPEVMT